MGRTVKTDIERIRDKGKSLTDIPKRYSTRGDTNNQQVDSAIRKEKSENWDSFGNDEDNLDEYE